MEVVQPQGHLGWPVKTSRDLQMVTNSSLGHQDALENGKGSRGELLT